ncbi:MAG: hypothetical protein LBP59_15180 [Planctomycetaceae bacterium]|jgi:hypothetical protein|nr:hypothetical protein [Planctomycetaceae bacterium]
MKTFLKLSFLELVVVAIIFSHNVLAADNVLTIPPLSICTFPVAECGAGDWTAKPETLDYEATKKLALEAEKEGSIGKALTLWERILDRTTCKESQRSETREHIKLLRPRVQINTDPKKAKIWNVLVIIYKEINAEHKNKDGKITKYHKTFTDDNLKTIGKELAGFRDLVFAWSSGVLLPEFKIVLIEEPLTDMSPAESQDGFPVGPNEIAIEFKKHSGGDKKFDTVIAYIKCRGDDGANINAAFTAAMYGRLRELNGAGYMMVPWATSYPYKNELFGEMELHEWLHQVDDLVHHNLGYPQGTTRSPDDGRGIGDNRPNGEEEYRRPKDCHTWAYFYKHLMTEHLTRQIWSELTTERPKNKPGAKIKIAAE